MTRPDDARDAIAFVRATATNDTLGRDVIARNCDPVAMVDALVGIYLGVLTVMTADPLQFLDQLLVDIGAATEDDQ